MARNSWVPLRKIPVRTVVDGVEVAGEIVGLWPNDIEVVITSPVSGLGTVLHVLHFAMCPKTWLATFEGWRTTGITKRSQRRAEELLRELYAYSQGERSGWGVFAVGPGGWTPLGEDD